MQDHIKANAIYFNKPGPKNTTSLLEAAAARMKELGIRKVVMATTTGRTVKESLSFFDPKECEIIAVTHVTGYGEPNNQSLDDELREELVSLGIKFVTAAHAFGGVGRGVRNKLGTFQLDEIMAHVLRMFGQGVKVGVEIAYMAADRGYIRTDEDVLSIGGTGRGADTAMILRPTNSHSCLDLKVREIIAKPWNP